MAIKSYEKNGKTLYQIYVNLRSKIDPKIRAQKTVSDLQSLSLARREENKIFQELGVLLKQREGRAETWESVLIKWEKEAKKGNLGEYSPITILDRVSALNRWTEDWLKIEASQLTKAHGRELIRKLMSADKSIGFIKSVKNAVNMIYNFGIEEGLIHGVRYSPVHGIKLNVKSEKVPDILTIDEIKKFLYEAKRLDHPWYPIWAFALLTGMRSGELYALEWNDIDLENNLIRVSKSHNNRLNIIKSTKAGYWRTVPISPELRNLILILKQKNSNYVLPRFSNWERGEQAKDLRMFLKGIGLPAIKFHALRACFATQLLAKGTPPAIVMKICGWRDLKTMEFYIRVAGVDEKGATDCLRILPSETEVMNNVVRLFLS
jgi:integrase